MTFHSLRSTWVATLLGFITAVLLASCGGGGAATSVQGGALSLLVPNSMYGGIPVDITIAGGRPPYLLVSSEPGVLSLPKSTNDNTITVLPANPGVIDVGLPPGSLPIRTVNITVRDANGNQASASTKVGQNFLTGYGMSLGTTTCASTGSTTTSAAIICAGGETTVTFSAVINGNLYGGREYRLDVVQGNFVLVNPATGATGASVGVTTDHEGRAIAIIRATANIPTQIAVLRLTDVASGVSTYESFVISGGSSSALLTALPNAFTFTGPDTATCGTGSGDFLVFDGVPPYSAVSSDSNISVTFVDPYHNPGRFRVTASNPNVCVTGGTIVVTDANNARTTVTVNTAKGSTPAAVPPTPLTVQPNSMTLGCAQSSSALIIGGASSSSTSGPSYNAVSTDPNLTAVVSGRVLTVTRAGPAGPGGAQVSSNVLVTDGSQTVNVTVTSPSTCP